MSKATNDFTYLEPGRGLPRADGSVCFDDRSGAGLGAGDERDLDRCGVREDHAYGRNWCSFLMLQAPHSSCLLSGSVESCSWPNTRCRLRNWVLSTTKSMGNGTGTDHRCTDSQADAVEGYKSSLRLGWKGPIEDSRRTCVSGRRTLKCEAALAIAIHESSASR